VGGAGTASEIALALKSDKYVVLFNNSKESQAFFKKIGGVGYGVGLRLKDHRRHKTAAFKKGKALDQMNNKNGFTEMQTSTLTTYSNTNFEQIATAIGVGVEPVANLEAQFEAAALWFRLDKRRPRRAAPSKQREKLTQVANSARRLLKSLGINDPDEAIDGPGDPEIFKTLVLTGEPDENPVVETTRRICRLVEIVEGIAAAAELEGRAQKVATEITEVGELTVQEGNPGDDAVNDWIAAMLGIYRTLTGKEPATSVGAPARPNEGIAAGPLIRFLQAASKSLKIEFSEDAWRSRVRTILKGASKQN
jgi:hypothetical protein